VVKRLIYFVLAALVFEATAAAGGDSQGSYMPVGRSNDPFVFCTEGVREHGWMAVNPMTGAWAPISQYVNYQWIPTYMAICPKAMGQGQWTGAGSGATVPFVH